MPCCRCRLWCGSYISCRKLGPCATHIQSRGSRVGSRGCALVPSCACVPSTVALRT